MKLRPLLPLITHRRRRSDVGLFTRFDGSRASPPYRMSRSNGPRTCRACLAGVLNTIRLSAAAVPRATGALWLALSIEPSQGDDKLRGD